MFILSGTRKGPTATHKDVTAEIEIPVGQFRFRRFLVDGVVSRVSCDQHIQY
jgi:hypothetical protein